MWIQFSQSQQCVAKSRKYHLRENNRLNGISFSFKVSVTGQHHWVDLSLVKHGRRLTGQTFLIEKECGIHHCFEMCINRKFCKSVNYNKLHLICELNLDNPLDATLLTEHHDYFYAGKPIVKKLIREVNMHSHNKHNGKVSNLIRQSF